MMTCPQGFELPNRNMRDCQIHTPRFVFTIIAVSAAGPPQQNENEKMTATRPCLWYHWYTRSSALVMARQREGEKKPGRRMTPNTRKAGAPGLPLLLAALLLLARTQPSSCVLSKLERTFVNVPSAEGAREALQHITSKPHVAGTPGDLEVIKVQEPECSFESRLRSCVVQVHTRTYVTRCDDVTTLWHSRTGTPVTYPPCARCVCSAAKHVARQPPSQLSMSWWCSGRGGSRRPSVQTCWPDKKSVFFLAHKTIKKTLKNFNVPLPEVLSRKPERQLAADPPRRVEKRHLI